MEEASQVPVEVLPRFAEPLKQTQQVASELFEDHKVKYPHVVDYLQERQKQWEAKEAADR